MNILTQSQYFALWYKSGYLRSSTKEQYKRLIEKFGDYMEERGCTGLLDFDRFYETPSGRLLPIDEIFFDEYVHQLKQGGRSTHTLFHTISALNSFFNFLLIRNLIASNPLRYYHNPYYKTTIKNRSLTMWELKKLLRAALDLEPFFRLYYVLILTLVQTGLRNSELCALRLSQVDFQRRTILVNRAHKRTLASVHIHKNSLHIELQRLVEHPKWQAWAQGQDKEVFFQNDEPFSGDQLRSLLTELSRLAGIPRRITPHMLRHTMARIMDANGVPVPIIQKQLRQKHYSTTLRYLPVPQASRDLINRNAADLLE